MEIVYEATSVADFKDGWNGMVNQFELYSNKWLNDLHAGR